MRRTLPIAALAISLLLVGCSRDGQAPGGAAAPNASDSAKAGSDAAPSAALRIVTTNAPIAFFAQRIGGDFVTVSMSGPDDGDPAFWSPKAEDITAMQSADLILLNGAGFEKWRSRVALPERKVVETAEGFRSTWIETKDGETHSHGLEGEHTHAGTAFTTWLDPMQAIEQAKAIRARLAEALPAQASVIDANYQALERDLRDIDARLESAVGTSHGLPLLFSHPIYDYLIRRFELNGRSVQWEPEAMPSEEEFARLAETLKEHPAKWMVWEDEPGSAIRTKLRELGVECVVVNPGSNMGTDWSGWLELQLANTQEFARVFE
jgi:zinc transport system substrate-binding protein